jgi:glycerophosphoryl diester phosphodiesterase
MILIDRLARSVIGHRGSRGHAPENTLASFQGAVALGVDAMEFDVRVSRDGMLTVFHDAMLERTPDTTGPLADRTAAELGRVDAGADFRLDGGRNFPSQGRGATVSTLDAIVELLPRAPEIPAATELVRSAIARYGIAGRVIVGVQGIVSDDLATMLAARPRAAVG